MYTYISVYVYMYVYTYIVYAYIKCTRMEHGFKKKKKREIFQ